MSQVCTFPQEHGTPLRSLFISKIKSPLQNNLFMLYYTCQNKSIIIQKMTKERKIYVKNLKIGQNRSG
jgi:hypothetical protein